MLSDFFVFVFLFDLVGDRTDVSVIGGQLCARTLGWKRGTTTPLVLVATTTTLYIRKYQVLLSINR